VSAGPAARPANRDDSAARNVLWRSRRPSNGRRPICRFQHVSTAPSSPLLVHRERPELIKVPTLTGLGKASGSSSSPVAASRSRMWLGALRISYGESSSPHSFSPQVVGSRGIWSLSPMVSFVSFHAVCRPLDAPFFYAVTDEGLGSYSLKSSMQSHSSVASRALFRQQSTTTLPGPDSSCLSRSLCRSEATASKRRKRHWSTLPSGPRHQSTLSTSLNSPSRSGGSCCGEMNAATCPVKIRLAAR
jgi:hypothetical protein